MPRAAAPQAMMPPAGDAATPAGTAGQAVGTGEQRADGPGASRREPPQHGTSQPGTSQLGTSQRGMPQYGMSQYGTPRYGAAESGSWWSGLPARLGAMHITQGFLPGAVLARSLGRQDCLGATMCLRRQDLERIGGLGALVDHLADDNVLGRRIAGIGLHVALAETLTLTTVPEDSFRALWRHELRWARTIRALEPAGFAASILRHPLAWALLTVLLSGGALWSIGLFFVAWMLRAIAALIVDGALARQWSRRPEGPGRESDAAGSGEMTTLAFSCPVWLLPLRDVLSVAALFASYGGRHVHWRGHGLHADTPPRSAPQPVT
ncbi:MAG TPA: glycosyltransferase, partial [Rhodopila sp.]